MKKILSLLLTVLLTATGCSASSHSAPEGSASSDGKAAGGANDYRRITMQEAVDMMASEKDYMILDVRTVSEYESGHIPGALCVPNESIGTADVPELPDKDQLILVYCRSGNRSKQASAKLVSLGYTNIVEFGGINSWPGEVVK